MAASDAAKPADIPAIMPATVDKTLFAVDKFFIQAIGIAAPGFLVNNVICRVLKNDDRICLCASQRYI